MSPEAGGTTVLLVGVLVIRLALTDAYLRYVQPAMGPWLLVGGVVLIVLGAVAVVRALRAPSAVGTHGPGTHGPGTHGPGTHGPGTHGPDTHGPDTHGPGDHHPGDHGHTHSDRTGWLLVVPVLAVLLAPPPALGSYGVDRGVTIASTGRTFPTLPTDGVPREMTLLEFGQRAADAGGASFGAQPVELTGFVAGGQDGGYRIARYQISCCAADAVAAVVRVRDASGVAHGRDAWVTVVGTFRDVTPDGTPELDAVAAQEVAAPVDPYEQ